ncbi:hypothetical protein DIPPA_17096 [Diplonema papillatum]|nr:hypothetical protein DIPPA_17096 [Diplonema papillatum]
MARAETGTTRKPAGMKIANGVAKAEKDAAAAPAASEGGSMIKTFTATHTKVPQGLTWAQKFAGQGKKDDDAPKPRAAEPAPQPEPVEEAPAAAEPAAPAAAPPAEQPQPAAAAPAAPTGAALWSGFAAKSKKSDKKPEPAAHSNNNNNNNSNTTNNSNNNHAANHSKKYEAAAVDEALEAPQDNSVPDSWEVEADKKVAAPVSALKAFEQAEVVVVVSESIYGGARRQITQDSLDKATKRYNSQAAGVVFPDNAPAVNNRSSFAFSGLQVHSPPPAAVAAAAPTQPRPKAAAAAAAPAPAAPVPRESEAAPQPAAAKAAPPAGHAFSSWADGDAELSGTPPMQQQNGITLTGNAIEDKNLLNRSKWGSAGAPGAPMPPPPAPTATMPPAMPPVGTMPPTPQPLSQPLHAGEAPFDRAGFGSATTSSYNPFSSTPSFGNNARPANGHAPPKKNNLNAVGSKGGGRGAMPFQQPQHAPKTVPPPMQGGRGGQGAPPSAYGYGQMLPGWSPQAAANYSWNGRGGMPGWQQFYGGGLQQYYGGYPMYGYPGYSEEQYYGAAGRGQQFAGYDRSLPHSNYSNYFPNMGRMQHKQN